MFRAIKDLVTDLVQHIIKAFRCEEIETLRDIVRRKENEIEGLREQIDTLKAVESYKESMPSDCVEGKWCKACSFHKTYSLWAGLFSTEVSCCTKGKSCPNFAKREDVE